MKLEEKLVSLRKAKGLSQLQLAEMINVSRQAISRWEVGAAVPSTDNLKYLARLYDVPLEYLLYDDAPEPNRAELKSEEEKINNTGDNKKKRRYIALILIAIGIAIAVLCVSLFGNKGEAPVGMEEIEGSDVTVVGDFKMSW